MRRIVCSLAILLALGLHAQNPGDLDLSFDGDGKLVIADIDSIGDPFAVPTSDLGLIIGFNRTVDGPQQTCLLRLNEDGSVNSSYGDQGLMVSTAQLQLKDVLIRTDDKVLLVGQVPGQEILRVERYLADGALDLSYGDAGVWETVIPDTIPNSFVSGGLMLPDDRILVNGSFGVIRVLADGGVDVGFGVAGVYTQGGQQDMALAPNGNVHWTNFDSFRPYATNFNGSDAGSYVNVPSCGPNVPMSNSITVNIDGRMMARKDDPQCDWLSYSTQGFAVMSSPYLLSGSYQAIFTNHPCWFSAYGATGQSSHGLVSPCVSDAFGNFYFTSTKIYTHDWGFGYDEYIYHNRVWVIGKANRDGSPAGFLYNIENVETDFLDYGLDSVGYPFVTSIFPSVDGRLLVLGHCEIDGAKRIVAARYHATPDPRSRANIRMFLGGNYDPATGLMHDSLRRAGLVPQLTPYDAPQFLMANGRGAFSTPASVLAVEGDSAVVDWVWLELMRDTLPGNVVATRVGLLHRNGWVTAADGRSPIDFGIGAGNYLLRARHRNHLSATTNSAITLGVDPVTVDLTDPATVTYGTAAQMEVNSVRMLWPGETNNDGLVRYAGSMNDRDRVLQAIGGTVSTATVTGYLDTDVNLDGVVKYAGSTNDRDVILQTIGGTVPTAVRVEQVP